MAKFYPKNPRVITKKQFSALADDLAELGDLGGIVHDLNSDFIIGGNQRSRVFDLNACDVVLTEVLPEPDAQGTVAHGYVIWKGSKYAYRQVRWSERQCEKANVVANKRGGTWDFDILADRFEQDDLLAWGFEPFELGLDEEPAEAGGDTEPEVDRAEELREKWQTAAGQLWQLGEHRLICGDCTDPATVARVMAGERAAFCMTDPPYGANYTGGTKKWEMLKGDRTATLYAPSLALVHEYTEPKAALYLFFSDEYLATIDGCLRQAGYDVRAQLIWNKNHAQFGAMGSQYKQKHEPLFYAFKHSQSPYWFGPNNEVTVWDVARANANEYHPTEKPPALYERALANSAPAGCIVYEPFSGSGTSVIACENTKRRCRAIEIDVGFTAVAIERWAQHTGGTPVLLDESGNS